MIDRSDRLITARRSVDSALRVQKRWRSAGVHRALGLSGWDWTTDFRPARIARRRTQLRRKSESAPDDPALTVVQHVARVLGVGGSPWRAGRFVSFDARPAFPT